MSYKNSQDIAFPWDYDDLMKLPLFMIEHIYQMMDQQLEENKKRYDAFNS